MQQPCRCNADCYREALFSSRRAYGTMKHGLFRRNAQQARTIELATPSVQALPLHLLKAIYRGDIEEV